MFIGVLVIVLSLYVTIVLQPCQAFQSVITRNVVQNTIQHKHIRRNNNNKARYNNNYYNNHRLDNNVKTRIQNEAVQVLYYNTKPTMFDSSDMSRCCSNNNKNYSNNALQLSAIHHANDESSHNNHNNSISPTNKLILYPLTFITHVQHRIQQLYLYCVSAANIVLNDQPQMGQFITMMKKQRLLTKFTFAIALSTYYCYKGMFSAFNSVLFWNKEGSMMIQPYTVATWSSELIGLITLSKSMVYLLVGVAQLSPLRASALSGIPLLMYLVCSNGLVTNTIPSIGFNIYFAPLVISYALLVNILTFTNIIPPKELRRYLYMPMMFTGLLAWLLPTTTASVFGVTLKTAMDKVLWIFIGRSLISTSTLIYSLALQRIPNECHKEISRAIRNMTAVTALSTIIDVLFLRRQLLITAGFSLTKAYRFILFTLTASGLLSILPEQ